MMSASIMAHPARSRNGRARPVSARRALPTGAPGGRIGPVIRSFVARDFPPAVVVAAKRGRRISVCLPARNEEATIGEIASVIRGELMERCPVIDELLVVDDGSTDRTADCAQAAGATVVAAATVLADHITGPGKGQAMWRAVHASTGDVIVFCDADVRSFSATYVLGLVGPLLEHDDLQLVKGFYDRPLDGRPGEGGRVTELTARPIISLLHPHLGPLVQPLAGELAARRGALESVPFVSGYGVDLGLLIDISARYGPSSLAQCDLGERVHRNRSLAELGPQALSILQVAMQRSGLTSADGDGPALPWTTVLQRPGPGSVPITMAEHPALRTVDGRRIDDLRIDDLGVEGRRPRAS
jgi:glucosyl-3-phosphoglycerate synthase